MPDNKSDSALVSHAGDEQLSLFEIVELPGEQQRYSNTIELYDALPKYNWAAQREYADIKDAPPLIRHCSVGRQDYKVIVNPAYVPKKGGSVLIYPGQREELIEDALRKLAVGGQALMVDSKVSVVFTLYQLQQELKSMGHSYNLDEIKESIYVCRGATLECYADDGATLISSSFFPTIGLTTKGEWATKKKAAKCFVQFHPMVTSSILNLTFRRFNYSLSMQINSPLARFLYKRMCHYFTHASSTMPYCTHLVGFLNQSPRGLSARMSENTRAMKNALEALIKHKVVSHYHEEQLKSGRSVLDVMYTIYPHDDFVEMVRQANSEQIGRQEAAQIQRNM